jgi:uncharacterized protein (DUF169 family)
MEIIEFCENEVGGRWVGIRFESGKPDTKDTHPVHFCEAVADVNGHPRLLMPSSLCCAGSLRCFGWLAQPQEDFIRTLADKSGIPADTVFRIATATPVLRERPAGILVGIKENPDIVISYAQPEAAMHIVRQWQARTGENLAVDLSSVMSVCGNIAVRAYLTGKICVSFGCRDSREVAHIGRDRLVVGIPKQCFSLLLGNNSQRVAHAS